MVFIFMLKLLLSLPFGILLVWKNRGQLLDRPEWRVVPELTIYFVLFTLFLLGSCFFPFFSRSIKKPGFIEAVGLVFVVALVVCESVLNGMVWDKRGKSDEKIGKTDNLAGDDLKEKKEYHKELFGYLSYTVVYISAVFLIFTLLELLLLNFVPSGSIKRAFGLDERKVITGWELAEMRLISIVGVGFTLCQMVENFKFSKDKTQKDRISNIKDYLAESSVKN